MASKAKEVAVKEKEKERDEAPPIGAAETTDTLLPLLDLSDAAVKRLIRITKKRGCVTHDQVKLPHERQGMRGIAPVTGMARAIRAINDGLNEGICASPRKPLKDMTTRDALIEDMARTDDAAACLLSYDVDARGSAPRVPARTFERTAPVASESRRPQVPAAGNSTRYEPTAETAYQPAEYYDDAHAVADEVGAQCERYDEYDAHDYSGRDYQDSYQLRGRKLWAAVAILALAMIGTAGAYSYRTMFGGEGQQQTAKIASVTANGDKQIQERLADRSTGERVVSREEQSLTIKDPNAWALVPAVSPPLAETPRR